MAAHTGNLSYLGNREQNGGLKPAGQKLVIPYLTEAAGCGGSHL
jgi:hypothetical protein